jgi:hypothetical protein
MLFMQLSLFLAKIFAVLYFVLGLSMVVNNRYYLKVLWKKFTDSPLLYATGVISLVGGLIVISIHNYWRCSWVTIVTVMGWICFVKGVFIVMLPKLMMKISEFFLKFRATFIIGGMFLVLLALTLGWFIYSYSNF